MAKANPVEKALAEASKGLLYPSETDAGFEAFSWPGSVAAPTAAEVLVACGAKAKASIEEGTLTEFFRAVPKSRRGDFLALAAALVDHLSHVKVFKVGNIQRTAYIVGVTADGKWAGIKTALVET